MTFFVTEEDHQKSKESNNICAEFFALKRIFPDKSIFFNPMNKSGSVVVNGIIKLRFTENYFLTEYLQ